MSRARPHVLVWDVDETRAGPSPISWAREVAGSLEQALARDVVVTVTPGRDVLFPEGSLRPGQHISLMGADGPGKAEIATAELGRATCSATTGSRRATAASSPPGSRRASSPATT